MARTALIAASLAFAACSSSSMSSPNCTTFTDLTAMTPAAVINFGGSFGNAYVPNCALVRVNQPITLTSTITDAFGVHPLSQTSGTPGAIPHTTSGSTVTFSIGAAGTYDYQCDVHHSQGMTGAIKVQ